MDDGIFGSLVKVVKVIRLLQNMGISRSQNQDVRILQESQRFASVFASSFRLFRRIFFVISMFLDDGLLEPHRNL